MAYWEVSPIAHVNKFHNDLGAVSVHLGIAFSLRPVHRIHLKQSHGVWVRMSWFIPLTFNV